MNKRNFLNGIIDKLEHTFDLVLERGEDPDLLEDFYEYLNDIRAVGNTLG